jgi:dipeptidyl aminopeptidase/acylaminoacyl peptidase
MIIHGSNDPRVKQAESGIKLHTKCLTFSILLDQFVDALKKNDIPVTYVVYPDEGHGMRKPKNMLAMSGFVEEFLHKCLHGDVEPFTLGQYNSSAVVSTRDNCR